MATSTRISTSIWAVIPWWYLSVPALLRHHQALLAATIADYFSFAILLRTFFQPWKRDEQSYEQLSLPQQLQVLGLNLMSRLFGAMMRAAAMIAGLVVLAALGIFFLFLWASWLLAPFLALLLIGLGLWTALGGLG